MRRRKCRIPSRRIVNEISWNENLRQAIVTADSHCGLPIITSLEAVTDAEEFQAYLDWITIEFDEDCMNGREAQRRLLEARRFLFE
jgi:hypothetical protein